VTDSNKDTICNTQGGEADGCGGVCPTGNNTCCVPDTSCASNTCSSDTCDDKCGTSIKGTKDCSKTSGAWKEVAP
jgi:hypothetical protein